MMEFESIQVIGADGKDGEKGEELKETQEQRDQQEQLGMLLRLWTRVRGFWGKGAVKRRESTVIYSGRLVTHLKKEI